MITQKTFLLCLLLLGCLAPAKAQQNPRWAGTGFEANLWAGTVIRHSKKMKGPLPEYSYALELNIVKQTFGQKPWQQRRNYPQLGVGLIYINYRDPKHYGSVIGVYPNIQLPIVNRDRWEWTVRAGMGIGYDTRYYQRTPTRNLQNTAIGGHLNNVSPFATDIRWVVNQHWKFQAGLSFVHVSNASFRQPNLGLNLVGGHIGLQYFPVTHTPTFIHNHLPELSNRWLVSARGSIAFVEKAPADGPLYPVYLGAIFASKRYWSKNKVLAGIDFAYNTGMYTFLKSIGECRGTEPAHSYQLALFLGNEFLLGHVGVLFQIGVYLKEPYQVDHDWYQKLGGNYYFYRSETGIIKEVFFSAFLKTHLTEAEFFEMGLGCSF